MLYFSQDYTPHDHRFLEALAGSEHQVHYLRLEDAGHALERRPVPTGIASIDWWGGRRRVHWWEFPRARRELKSVIRQISPDLVHAGPVQGPALLTAAAGFRPLVTMSWGSDLLIGARKPTGKWAAQYTLARTAALVCDSQAVQRRATSLGMDARAIVKFPWGVDLEHFAPGPDAGLRDELGWQDNLVLLSTRAWEPLLGVDVLVRGFVQAAERAPELRLLVLGAGSLEAKLKGLIASHALQNRVHFAGQVAYQRIPRYYRAADLYLSASHSDGSSVSLLEAMACGVPALVSDIPGNREWVEPGMNGWWFRDGKSDELAEQLATIDGRRAELPLLGTAARQRAVDRANWKVNFNQLTRAYEQAMSSKAT